MELEAATLAFAYVVGAVLVRLQGQDMDLQKADLSAADLQRANLAGAKVSIPAWRETTSLLRATMPDGSLYNHAAEESPED